MIIAPTFGSIFYQNCIRNGLLPVRLSEVEIRRLADYVETDPAAHQLLVDLEACTVSAGDIVMSFEIAGNHRDMLLQGLDPIGLTLMERDKIEAFEQSYLADRGWLVRVLAS